MNIKEIEALLAEADKLDKLIEHYQDSFDRLNYYEDLLRSGTLDTPHDIDMAMQELVAIYSTLNVATRIAETKRVNTEVVAYHREKIDAEKNSIKTTEKYLEVLSKIESSGYRRIQSIFEGYKDSVDRIISVLQSSLKAIERDRAHHA